MKNRTDLVAQDSNRSKLGSRYDARHRAPPLSSVRRTPSCVAVSLSAVVTKCQRASRGPQIRAPGFAWAIPFAQPSTAYYRDPRTCQRPLPRLLSNLTWFFDSTPLPSGRGGVAEPLRRTPTRDPLPRQSSAPAARRGIKPPAELRKWLSTASFLRPRCLGSARDANG